MHANFSHVLFNMVAVLTLGTYIERRYGSQFFFALTAMLVLINAAVDPFVMILLQRIELYAYGASDWTFSCALGFSGVIFSFMLIWAYTGEKY